MLSKEVLQEVADKAIPLQFRDAFDKLMNNKNFERATAMLRNWVARGDLSPADKKLCELLLDDEFIGAA